MVVAQTTHTDQIENSQLRNDRPRNIAVRFADLLQQFAEPCSELIPFGHRYNEIKELNRQIRACIKPSYTVVKSVDARFLEAGIINVSRDCETSQEIKCNLKTKLTSLQLDVIDGTTLNL